MAAPAIPWWYRMRDAMLIGAIESRSGITADLSCLISTPRDPRYSWLASCWNGLCGLGRVGVWSVKAGLKELVENIIGF